MQQKYDVFVNFRGEDIRYNFLSHLIAALDPTSLKIFVDSRINSGDKISQALISAIENSKLALTIFSPRYASSRWCLNELVEIIKCRDNPTINQKVIPVFYHVAPHDVKGQKESFAKSFKEHEDSKYPENRENVQKWKEALGKACEHKGICVKETSPESDAVVDIVNDVLKALGRPPMENKLDQSSNSVKLIHTNTIELQVKGKIWTLSSEGIHIENLDSLLNMLNLQAPPSSSLSTERNPQTNSSQTLTDGQTEGSTSMGSSDPGHEQASIHGQIEESESTGTAKPHLPGARGQVVLFLTSSSEIKETVERCDRVRKLLEDYRVSFNGKDISKPEHRKELEDVFKEKPVDLPELFVTGDYIGGYEELKKLQEGSKLENILLKYQRKIDAPLGYYNF